MIRQGTQACSRVLYLCVFHVIKDEKSMEKVLTGEGGHNWIGVNDSTRVLVFFMKNRTHWLHPTRQSVS